jgi:hypothetical protein
MERALAESDIVLTKSENRAIVLASGIGPRLAGGRRGAEEVLLFEIVAGHNPPREFEAEADFSI